MRRLSGRNSSVLAAGTRLAHPRLVVQRVDDARLAGLRIERDDPAILVVRGSRRGDHLAAVGRDDRHRPANLAIGAPAGARRLAGACPAAGGAGFSGSATGGAKLPSAHTLLPVLRLSTASRRRSCVSPTFVRAGMSSV